MRLPFLANLLRAIALVVVFLSVAHAADDQPNLFKSLGKLPAPDIAPALDATSRGMTIATPAQGRRIALVIGNGNYQYSDSLPKLANPQHDAEDIAKALRGFGFEVIERKNQTLEAMNQSIAEFGSRIGGSEAALFYFAGHGLQVKGQNYLMPVNAKIESEAVVPYQGVNVNQILDEMDNGKSSANIVMLDACRNNPISGKFRSGKSRGLASPGNTPKGTVIVYATDPGNVAADGDGRNGLFTAGLLTAFKGKDLSLDDVLTVASAEVERASGQTQSPYVNGPKTLQKNFYFRVTVEPGRAEIEKTFWTSIEHSTDQADFEAYIRKYPKGSYRALAENQIKRLKASQQAASAPVAVLQKPVIPIPVAVEDLDTPFWNEVKAIGTRESFDAYLKKYPKGKFLAAARVEIKKIDDQDKARQVAEAAETRRVAEAAEKQRATEAAETRRMAESAEKQRLAEAMEKQQAIVRERQEAQRVEQSAWDNAKAGASASAYAVYLEKYPKGRYAALAQSAQKKTQREVAEQGKQEAQRLRQEKTDATQREEAALWSQAENAVSVALVQTYLDRYPAGRYIAEARIKLVALKKEPAGQRPGQVFKDCADCPEMVVIPAGSFEMGATVGGADEEPVHTVKIAKAFALGKIEVTQGQWRAIMGNNPSRFSECGDDCPVEKVKWDDVQEYVKKLNQKTGMVYRLPSEAEWEYACRAGTSKIYCGDDVSESVAWLVSNSGLKTSKGGGKQANAWGLFDMSGNVMEWTADCWNDSYQGAPTDGSAWVTGQCSDWHVLRGGSWGSRPKNVRATARSRYVTSERGDYGFRLARTLP